MDFAVKQLTNSKCIHNRKCLAQTTKAMCNNAERLKSLFSALLVYRGMNFQALLVNKTFLYVVLAISVASMFGYVVGQRTDAILFFALAGYVTSYFSKNMTVILLVALLLTNFVFSLRGLREGLEGQAKDPKTAKTESRTPTDKQLSNIEGNVSGESPPASGAVDAEMSGQKDIAQDAAAVGKAGKKQNGKGNGAAGANADVKPHSEPDNKKTKDMTYSYFEQALGDGGVDKLSKDMDVMVDKHQKLQKMIETMGPMIQKAGELLDKVNTTNVGGIGDMVSKMSGLFGALG